MAGCLEFNPDVRSTSTCIMLLFFSFFPTEITIPLRNNSSPERIGFVNPADALITSSTDNIIIVLNTKMPHKSDLYLI